MHSAMIWILLIEHLLVGLALGQRKRRNAEGLLILGGGTPVKPEQNLLVLRPDGTLCQPSELILHRGIYGPGVARVTGGILVCGGRVKLVTDVVDNECWLLSSDDRPKFEKLEDSEIPGLLELDDSNFSCSADPMRPHYNCFDGSVIMANNRVNPRKRDNLFLFVQGTDVMYTGVYKPDPIKKVEWTLMNNTARGYPPKRKVARSQSPLRSDPCVLILGNHVLLFGGVSADLGNEYPALDYGMILDLSNETSQWETFPLLDPPRHSMGCALEMVYWKEGKKSPGDYYNTTEETPDKVIRKLLWLVGGEGGYANQTDLSDNTWAPVASPLIDVTRLLNSSAKAKWLVGDKALPLRLSEGRSNPAFAILSDGFGTQKVVMSCSFERPNNTVGNATEENKNATNGRDRNLDKYFPSPYANLSKINVRELESTLITTEATLLSTSIEEESLFEMFDSNDKGPCSLSVDRLITSDVHNIRVVSQKVNASLQDRKYFIPPK